MSNINVKLVSKPGAVIPEYKTSGAAGADVCAYLPEESVQIEPGKVSIIPTGLFFEIPEGYENGVTVLNTPGTIDSDYRGELKVILINLGEKTFTINNGERIAQIIIAPVIQADFEITQSLSQTQRGEGGFGSTGV